jgi:glycosyltransferase involved in cell wall biosynthesis
MHPQPTISVLMTAYNRERYIAEAIDSVLAQTYQDFELVVSDDCSSDRTLEIVNDYARRDRRIRVSVNERNLGDYGNRRQVASLAVGRYLKYHDSDDLMYRHCLQTMIEPLEAEPRAGFALAGGHHWPGGPCPMLLTPRLAYEREYLGSGLFHLGPACALFRAEVLRELGGFPETVHAADYLFWIRACSRVNLLLVPSDLFYYRVHPDQEAAKPANDLAYAHSAAVAWRMLNSDQCPLTGAPLTRAKSNFAFTQARGIYRHLKQRRVGSALAVLTHSGLGALDWVRYLRPPRRTANAGTPSESKRAS